MKIYAYREDVTSHDPETVGFLPVGAVLISEHLAPGRVCSLGTKTELQLKPGTIYRAFTGIGLEGITSAAQLTVRASEGSWRAGLTVLRFDVDASGEIIVYFAVMIAMDFNRREPLFQVAPIGLRPVADSGPVADEMERHNSKPANAGLALSQGKEKHIRGPAPESARVAEVVDSDKAAQAKVQEWLNTPDEKGKVVQAEDTGRREVSVTAQVQSVAVPGAGDDQRIPAEEAQALGAGAFMENPQIAENQARIAGSTGPDVRNTGILPTTPTLGHLDF